MIEAAIKGMEGFSKKSTNNLDMRYVEPEVAILGGGSPTVGLVAGMHGDERAGVSILHLIKERITLKQGTLKLIIANPLALERGVRYIDADLNRIFPGKADGCTEEKLAHKLVELGKDCDYLIDLHSCGVESDPFCIVRKVQGRSMEVAEITNLPHIVVYPLQTQKGGSFIDYVSCGIGMELGLHEKEETILSGYHAVLCILKSLSMIHMSEDVLALNVVQQKYKVIGHLHKMTSGTHYATLKNFSLITTGEKIGENETGAILADRNFYPVLSNEPAYKDNGGWVSVRLSAQESMKKKP